MDKDKLVTEAGLHWKLNELSRELIEASAKLVEQQAEIKRLRAALLKIKRGSVWNCDIEAFIDAALAQEKPHDR